MVPRARPGERSCSRNEPVAASSVADYLANPRDNSAYLLSDDVNTGGEPFVETARAVKNYSAETQRASCKSKKYLPTWSASSKPL